MLLKLFSKRKSSVLSWWLNYQFLFNLSSCFYLINVFFPPASPNRRSPVSSQPPVTKANLSGKILCVRSQTLNCPYNGC